MSKETFKAKFKRFLKQREIVLITGVRRSGKSSLMKLICWDILTELDIPPSNILYLNFDDERFIDFTVRDFQSLYEAFIEIENPKGKRYFFLDEIQNIKGWERWVNRLYEFEDVKIFITGSNASMLSSEVSTALTGRNRQITNWHFSFSEFLSLENTVIDEKAFYRSDQRADIKRLFKWYLTLGGFPEVLKSRDITILEQYFKDIIYRDVIARYAVRNIKEIMELTLFLSSNIGLVQSYGNLKRLIKVKSINTVKNYLNALSDVFLFFLMDLFDFSIKWQTYNPSNVYCIDTALSRAVSVQFSQNLGHIYENIVFLELKRRSGEIFYWKSKDKREVDFIVKRGAKIEKAIQVAVSLADKKTRDREIQALKDVVEELDVSNLFIITEDEEGTENLGSMEIKIIPIWKWLFFYYEANIATSRHKRELKI